MAESETDFEALDAEQMPGDVPEEERGDGHGREVQPPDAHACACNQRQVAFCDELVSDEREQLHRAPR